MQAFLAGAPTYEPPITPLLKVGEPRQLIVATAEALGIDLLVIGAHSKRNFAGASSGSLHYRPPWMSRRFRRASKTAFWSCTCASTRRRNRSGLPFRAKG